MELDVIIPAYNEEDNILNINNKLHSTLKGIKYNLIYIDDGSNDNTYKELEKVYKLDNKHTKVIRFSRNFGKDAAIYAGMKESNAKYTVIIDADLQQDPKLIVDMLNKIKELEDTDVICMVNDYSNELFISKILKKIFYYFMNKACDQKFISGASDFRLFNYKVRDAIVSLNEKNRFTKGLFSWVGFNTYYMKYKAKKRIHGKSKFRLKKQISYAIDGLVNFSIKPLRIATILGSIISITSFIALFITAISNIIGNIPIHSTALLIYIILFVGGIQLLVLGIIGEYLAKNYIENKNRPIYIEKDKLTK